MLPVRARYPPGVCQLAPKRALSYCYLFPGQGSQYVGMCKDVLSATEKGKVSSVPAMFDLAGSIFQTDFKTLFLNGPKSMLDSTLYCQPAVVLASLVALETFKERIGSKVECLAAAGFSVGELTALIAAGSLTLEQGFSLIKVRAEAMQEACNAVDSCMVTVSRLEKEALVEVLQSTQLSHSPPACVSIFLCPGRAVVSGSAAAVADAVGKARQLGAVAKKVKVAGAFHSKLMSPALPRLETALESVPMQIPKFPLYSNVTGQPYSDVGEIKRNLALQVTQPVLWHQTMLNMIRNHFTSTDTTRSPRLAEVGPNSQLKNLVKHIDEAVHNNCDSWST